jgi:hypothetical protein
MVGEISLAPRNYYLFKIVVDIEQTGVCIEGVVILLEMQSGIC